ncbi:MULTISPECIES: type II toxin-antitoxin system mRNA interferase toxin, RelE/StbE family [unclassified Lactobacillus]|uniref:type II toxin-antitoxin system mRNA interferase toxin, RelE/StbE family n=1 Tax=unclassified Lactobacillus TaxID=2620435 RepID=UPI00223ED62A|nr:MULTISPECIES: type II toxin-antitoxin system mRNA interferase toxin, RelE/StbE family [unclassified Lactobacillus]
MYQIKTTKLFDKRFANLKKLFNLTQDEANDAIESLKYTMMLLQQNGKLPRNGNSSTDPDGPYYDHKLTDEPWSGFNEYHILGDVLVVYYKLESKRTIRFTTITTHNELRQGNLD